MPAPLLEVIDLHKHFDDTVALVEVGFQVEAGQLFGLLGPNGAGKTTLLSIAAGTMSADAGDVRILGQSMTNSTRELRRRVGFVPQELALYGTLTARENLRFFGQLYGVSGATLERRVDEVLSSIGLADRADTHAGDFSGGMKRRLNLGMALVHEPELLLLDEPTTGVDPHSRRHIFQEVRRLHDAGVTIVYTSHYMQEVEELCERVAILNQGKLIACDDVARLLGQVEGLLRFRVADAPPEFRERLAQFTDARLLERDASFLELVCRDVKATLMRLLALLKELKLELLSLETEEPDLERVFMEMTGAHLRD